MSRVHDILHWSNRREVAREITKRGYRVSGETLNRWVREESEVPAVVEHIVFDLFTITGHDEAAPPWAERLQASVDAIAESQRAIADEAVRRLSGAMNERETEMMGVAREALADALSETSPSPQPGDERPSGTGEADTAGEGPRPPRPSARPREK